MWGTSCVYPLIVICYHVAMCLGRLRRPAEIGLHVWLCFVRCSFFDIFQVFIKKIDFSRTIACIELILCLCCLFRPCCTHCTTWSLWNELLLCDCGDFLFFRKLLVPQNISITRWKALKVSRGAIETLHGKYIHWLWQAQATCWDWIARNNLYFAFVILCVKSHPVDSLRFDKSFFRIFDFGCMYRVYLAKMHLDRVIVCLYSL